ncbi:MAG: PD40 domain-containing protein [Chloroflexi bacterium]|nr:PD40 domain-containing protein [Chloroflexota bacterium]
MTLKLAKQSHMAVRVLGILVCLSLFYFLSKQLPVLPLWWRYSNLNLVLSGLYHYEVPRWSPDGSRIIFYRSDLSEDAVFMIEPNGRSLIPVNVSGRDAAWPDWSPDGKQIVFASRRSGNYQIYIMNTDGSNVTPITRNFAYANCPRWSPDGKWIAFCARLTEADANPQLYIISTDGKNMVQLTDLPVVRVQYFDWSPDSTQIVFAANTLRTGTPSALGVEQHLFVINTNQRSIQQIDSGDDATYYPTWAPDGKKILFTYSEHVGSSRNLPTGLYIMNVDGTGRRMVLPANCNQPHWSELRNEIVFVCGVWGAGELSIYRMEMRDFLP